MAAELQAMRQRVLADLKLVFGLLDSGDVKITRQLLGTR
jgi:hypothetical protein